MTNAQTYDKQIENLKQYRTFGGDKPLPGSELRRTGSCLRRVRKRPAETDQPRGSRPYMFGVIRTVSVPIGLGDPDSPKSRTRAFPNRVGPDGGRYYIEST